MTTIKFAKVAVLVLGILAGLYNLGEGLNRGDVAQIILAAVVILAAMWGLDKVLPRLEGACER